MARFTDKVIIVTGAASGIGEAAARRFAAEGGTLVLGDKKTDGIEKLAAGLDTPVETLETDISDPKSCAALVARATEKFGRIDVLVNNAGIDHLGRIDEGNLPSSPPSSRPTSTGSTT